MFKPFKNVSNVYWVGRENDNLKWHKKNESYFCLLLGHLWEVHHILFLIFLDIEIG